MKALGFLSEVFVVAVVSVTLSVAQSKPGINDRGTNVVSQKGHQAPTIQSAINAARHTQTERNQQPSGTSPIIFLPTVYYDVGSCSVESVADLNGDHKPDIIAGCFSGGVAILLGNGDGTFQSPVYFSSGGDHALSVAVGDLNHDGKLDLVVANECNEQNCVSGKVGVLLGNGDGTFQPAVAYDSGGAIARAIAVGDLNNDGKLDAIVLNACILGCNGNPSGAVGVLLGNGDGTLQPVSTWDTGGYDASGLAVGDVNGDGNLDVAVANNCAVENCQGDGNLLVLLGNGEGAFGGALYSWQGSGQLETVALADVNGDGHLDLLGTGFGSQVGVFLGNGDGSFQSPVFSTVQVGGALAMAVADVDHDGHPDLVVAGDASFMALLMGNGDGTFGNAATYYADNVSQVTGVTLADVNGDGLPDWLISPSVGVLLNNSQAPPSTTVLTASVNPVNAKQTVTYTAKMTRQSGGPLNGIVTFRDGGYLIATVPVANNQAALSTSYLGKKRGAHAITATYGGEYQVATGSGSALTEYVRATVSKTTLFSSGSPSRVGQSVTFTATVTSPHAGGIPDGETVTFSAGKTILGTSSIINSVATLTTSFSKPKTYSIKAAYPGDNVFDPSSKTVKQVVNP